MQPELVKAFKLLYPCDEGEGCAVKWHFLNFHMETIFSFYSRQPYITVQKLITKIY